MKRLIGAMTFATVVGLGAATWVQAGRWTWDWSGVNGSTNRLPSQTQEGVTPSSPELLRVNIHGLRSDKGKVLAVLFTSPENFPDRPTGTPITAMGVPHNGEVILEFPGTAPRAYAVAVIHDEDDNGQMNKGFLGIPTEGFGFSNDAPTFMGPPSYKSCEFQKHPGLYAIDMKMKYM